MFRTRISFSRLFRLRKRRPGKVDPGSASVAQPPPPPALPPKQHQLHFEAIHTATPITPSHQHHSLYSATAPSPLPTSLDVPSPHVILVEHLVDEPTLNVPPPPAHAPPGSVEAQPLTKANGASRLAPSPTSRKPNARSVSFQLPSTTKLVDADTDTDSAPDSGANPDTDTDSWQDRPSTPSSTCSTLVGAPSQAKGGIAVPVAVPMDQPPDYIHGTLTLASTPGPPVSASTSAKARHVSLFHPRPVGKNVARFSMPARPAPGTGISMGTRDDRRASAMPLASGSAMTKREKRTTRWSKELNKPGTQEVLMALRGL